MSDSTLEGRVDTNPPTTEGPGEVRGGAGVQLGAPQVMAEPDTDRYTVFRTHRLSIYDNVAYGPRIGGIRIEDLMREIKTDCTIVIVTHNMQQAARVSDRTEQYITGRFG